MAMTNFETLPFTAHEAFDGMLQALYEAGKGKRIIRDDERFSAKTYVGASSHVIVYDAEHAISHPTTGINSGQPWLTADLSTADYHGHSLQIKLAVHNTTPLPESPEKYLLQTTHYRVVNPRFPILSKEAVAGWEPLIRANILETAAIKEFPLPSSQEPMSSQAFSDYFRNNPEEVAFLLSPDYRGVQAELRGLDNLSGPRVMRLSDIAMARAIIGQVVEL